MKPAEFDIDSLSPRVRQALEQVRTEAQAEAWRRSLEIAAILAGLRADDDVVLAGALVPLLGASAIDAAQAAQAFGEASAQLALELRRVGGIGIPGSWRQGQGLKPEQAEGLRKLLLALAADVRLVLVRLALQLADLRAIKTAGREEQLRAALETREIYAPLASRLGVWQLKWELEDLAFRYAQPEDYRRIAGWLRATRGERERFIDDVRTRLERELSAAGVTAEISGRPKHIYSIWRKMERKRLVFDQVMDVLAVRIKVGTVADCYAALGLVHGLWQYIPGEFDDYIATPKDNNYRSLHTAVIGPGRLPLEIQIRTHEMHDHAELGVAAHWQYKEGRRSETSYQQKINWLRQLLEPGGREDTEPDLLTALQSEIFEDRVYALSPRGEVVDLPRGATPLDFAYHVHTSLGHRCRGARVNGRMVPLDFKLSTGDSVEILPGKQPKPSRDWLVPKLGFLASARNRAKVRGWFRKLDKGENREQGKQMFEREIDRLGVRAVPLPEILRELELAEADALYQGLGSGEITVAQVVGAIQRRAQAREPEKPRPSRATTTGKPAGMVIDGVGDLMSSFARCCRPVPPEQIAGYITVGRGVSIHRAGCANLLRLRDAQPQRVLAVDWGSPSADRRFPVAVAIHAFDRRGLVRDISSVLADERVSIDAMNSLTNAAENTADVDLRVSVQGLDELSRLLARLSALPNVISARRRG
ncbi:MAG TPA: bifunctional (p)ppGpp synthetase/guanosine-3',5'-bis(diphosphate) 3'-pyrophosphohydrolase [Steroidobacteraceae bacterium]